MIDDLVLEDKRADRTGGNMLDVDDTLTDNNANGHDVETEDWLNVFAELDKDFEEIDKEIEAKEVDHSIGDWEFISQLLETFNLMNSSLNLTAVLEHVIDAAISVIQAERGFLMLMNSEGGLEFTIARDSNKNSLTDREFQLSNTFLQQAVNEKRIAYIEDALTDRNYLPTQSVQSLKLRSILCCPMLAKGDIIGVIYADSPKPLIGRSKVKSQLFQIFADQAAVAIRNAQLYQRLKNSFDKLQNAHESLIFAEKMAARGKMAARIGHELNNLLAGIYGNLELSIKCLEEEKPQSEGLYRLRKVAGLLENISRFSQGLMSNSHIETRLVKTNLNDLIQEFLDFSKPVYQKTGATFEEAFDPNLPEIEIDKGQIHQILYNLVTNAIEVKPNTHVTITTKYISAHRHILIKVSDTGPGIDSEKLKQIFKPLFTEKAGGHGYGLSICQEIAKKHGGRIFVSSKVGFGTEFTVVFPVFDKSKKENPGTVVKKTMD